jgi:hypothetical protein
MKFKITITTEPFEITLTAEQIMREFALESKPQTSDEVIDILHLHGVPEGWGHDTHVEAFDAD